MIPPPFRAATLADQSHIYSGWRAGQELFTAVAVEDVTLITETARPVKISMFESDVVSLEAHQCVVANDPNHAPVRQQQL
jgi:hypothetical protein